MAVTIASLLKNNSRHTFRLIVVLNERDERSEQKIRAMVAGFQNAEIEFKTFKSGAIAHFRVDRHITLASYLRLFMTRFLDPDLEKVLYLDCDLVVCEDVEELWLTDVSQHFMAAVRDLYSDNHIQLGLKADETYFNAGVLLVNLQKWRETDVVPRFIEYVEKNSAILRYHDQCTLNATFRNQILPLPYRWNFAARYADLPSEALGMSPEEFSEVRRTPPIVHFSTEVKPWLYAYEPHYKKLYFEYLGLTPWAGSTPDGRNIQSALVKFLKMERLRELFKWWLPGLYRSICRVTGLGEATLRQRWN